MTEGFGWTQRERSLQSPRVRVIRLYTTVKQMEPDILKTLNKTLEWRKRFFSGIVLTLSACLTAALYCCCQPLSHGCCIINVPALIEPHM